MRRSLLLAGVLALALTPSAAAAPVQPPLPTPPLTTTPAPPPAALAPPSGGLLASPDTTLALGGTDASCAHLSGASAQVVTNCNASGLAESAYPPANFGLDTHVDTGITDPANDAAAFFQEIIGGFYSLVAHLLTWILLALGLAFGFDLFNSDKSGQITKGLGSVEGLFTTPLLPVIIIVGAIVGMVYWFGQRSEGRAVVHWAAMAAMMAFALVIIQNPVGVFGWVDQTANGVSSGSLAAFSGQGGAGTSSGFADAVPGIYRTTMEEPWCSLEFGDVAWCMAPIDPAMAAARSSVLAHLDQALGDQGTPELAKQQAPVERLRLAAARTNGELFLSFPPNSDARNGKNDTWTFYHALLQDRPDLAAIRGPGGVWERFGILFLACLSGLAFLFLVLFIAWQLLAATVFFVLALLLAPVAIFLPAFGESGRGTFMKWLTWMIESLFKKVVFAIYLGVILAVTGILFRLGQLTGHWLLLWLLEGVVWTMALVYHSRILNVMTMGIYDSHTHSHPGARAKGLAVGAGAAYAWKRSPQRVATVHEHHHEGSSEVHQHVHVNGYAPRDDAGRERVPVPNYEGGRRPGTIEGTTRELEE